MSIEVSSTGALGRHERSYGRIYYNYEQAVTGQNIDEFLHDAKDTLAMIDGQEITRAAVRAVISSKVFDDSLSEEGHLLDHIEAVAPLPTGEYLTYFGNNSDSRKSSTMDNLQKKIMIKNNSLLSGYSLTNGGEINPEKLYELWRSFEWRKQGVRDFLGSLATDKARNPEDRSIWFSGINNSDGELVSAMMAERLDMPSSVDIMGRIALVEFTEFATAPHERGKGLITHIARNLANSVRDDLSEVPHLIFAECNTDSKSDHSAARAGFNMPKIILPNGKIVRQNLEQNVAVDGALRDFRLMTYLGESQS